MMCEMRLCYMMRFHDFSRECAQHHWVSSSFQTMFDCASHLSGFLINDNQLAGFD
jgi:hypothetical protein